VSPDHDDNRDRTGAVELRSGGPAATLLGTRERGQTDYIPDPDLVDPASVSKWRFERTPRVFRMIGGLPLATFFIIFGVLLALLLGLVTAATTGLLSWGNAIVGGIIPAIALVALALAARFMIPEARRRRCVVLEHDATTGKLTVHADPIDAAKVEAVERVSFTIGKRGVVVARGPNKTGTDYTTGVHLGLRERLDDEHAQDPTSVTPGIRYRVVACAHLGLKSHGRRIADRLGVEYTTASLGAIVHDATGKEALNPRVTNPE